MPVHRVGGIGRLSPGGQEVEIFFDSEASIVRCRVLNEAGGTVVVPLDELLNQYAGEINGNTEALTGKEPLIKNAAAKTTLVNADTLPLTDSADSKATKKITFTNLKAVLKTYFDSLYNKVTVNNTLTSTSTTEALSAAQGKALNDGKVPTTRKVAGKALTADVTLSASDVGAAPTTHTHTIANVTNLQTSLDGKATAKTYTATLTTTWSGATAPYTQTVTVTGLTAAMTPIVDLVLSATLATALLQLEAWAKVGRIVTGANSITAYCYEEKPVTAIPLQLKVVE